MPSRITKSAPSDTPYTPTGLVSKKSTRSNTISETLSYLYDHAIPKNITINSIALSLIGASTIFASYYVLNSNTTDDPSKPTTPDYEGGIAIGLSLSMVIASVTATIQCICLRKKETAIWFSGFLCMGAILTTTHINLGSEYWGEIDPFMIPESNLAQSREDMIKYFQTHKPDCDYARPQIRNNYHCHPGYHSFLSPVTGSRAHEYNLIVNNPSKSIRDLMSQVHKAIYNTEDKFDFIKDEHNKEAFKISREMLSNYIEQYRVDGVDEENVVSWFPERYPIGSRWVTGKGENKEEWKQWAPVSRGFMRVNKEYLWPEGITAIHEIMHLEETKPFTFGGTEVLTTTKSIMLLDEIYKRVHGIDLDTEVDYNRMITIGQKEIPTGRYINFYRNLEIKKKNLAEAYVSEESIDFLTKSD